MTIPDIRWRENLPLYGVGLVLLVAFAALALFGSPQAEPTGSDGASSGERVRPGAHAAAPTALPADGADDAVIASALAPDAARQRNAQVGFAARGPGSARPFVFAGNSADRARARECLALAAMAEAGGGDDDQRAVIQVILNRVRHPAFAKTVCGVVFQGSERATGCQFSFTCDGSLARRYPETLWRAARQRAEEALGGRVHAPVGNATHFHADYVYPWWSAQLDKVAQVGPHLFFRWRGFWGTPQALSARYRGGEPDPLALRGAAQAVERPAELLRTLAETGEAVRTITSEQFAPAADVAPGSATPAAPAVGFHFVLVGPGDAPATLVDKARALCPDDRYCQVYGWTDSAAVPEDLPLTEEARSALAFSFRAGSDGNSEAIFFDCRLFPDSEFGTCLPRARN